jgi:hypothetical protein
MHIIIGLQDTSNISILETEPFYKYINLDVNPTDKISEINKRIKAYTNLPEYYKFSISFGSPEKRYLKILDEMSIG